VKDEIEEKTEIGIRGSSKEAELALARIASANEKIWDWANNLSSRPGLMLSE